MPAILKRGGWDNGEQSMATSKPFDPSSLPVGPFSRDIIDAKSNDGEKSSGNLGDLLDQVSKNSVGEVDGLIGELRQLNAKLQADGDRIKRDIQEYETLSQQVMQLTKIISDSLATISKTPATNGRTSPPSISWRKADYDIRAATRGPRNLLLPAPHRSISFTWG
jgi:hypothetical protein